MGEEEGARGGHGPAVFGPGVGPVCVFLKIHQATHLRVYILVNFT